MRQLPIAISASPRFRQRSCARFQRRGCGTSLEMSKDMIERLEDLHAFQLAVAFKLNVYELFRGSAQARQDFSFKRQLFDAAASVEMNLAEGWGRMNTAEMRQFFRYARGSIYEARQHVRDGISRGYFAPADCEKALVLANRSAGAITNLWKSLEQFTENPPRRRKPREIPRTRRPPEPGT